MMGTSLPGVVLAAPGCLLAAGCAVMLGLGSLGQHPLWPHRPLNLSEAAGMNDEAEVVRLIEAGHDPNAIYDVPEGLILSLHGQLRPIEAAVMSGDPSMVHTLLTRGASIDGDTWSRLRCMADDDVGPMLDRFHPEGAIADCEYVGSW